MPVRRGEPGSVSGPARLLSLFRRMKADADPVRLVHTAGDEPPSPDAFTPHDIVGHLEQDDLEADRLRDSRQDNPFLRRLSDDGRGSSSPDNGHHHRRRTSSAGAGDPLSAAELHPRLVRSPPPSRSTRRASPIFFPIHEKAKIVVIPTSQLRPLRVRQREDVMDRSLQYILQTQQALPIKRVSDLSAERNLSRRLSGATAPPLAPRVISAISSRSGRLGTDRSFDQLPGASLSASYESKDAIRKANPRGGSPYSLGSAPNSPLYSLSDSNADTVSAARDERPNS